MATVPIEIGVLGPLEVRRAGTLVEVRGSRPRTALAALAAHAPHPISHAGLATAIWGEDLPERPRGAVQTVVSRLRAVLGTGTIRAGPGGYCVDLPCEGIDAQRFEALCRQAGRLPPETAAAVLDSALRLWRGPAYVEFVDRDFALVEAARLGELRTQAMEDRAGLALGLDDAATAVSVLRQVIAEQPLRERAHGLLMTSLYRAGRTTEALDQYQSLRVTLSEELGLDPSPALRELQEQILDHSVPVPPPSPPVEPTDSERVRRQLPLGWRPGRDGFIGREDDLVELEGAATVHRLVCVTGPGGVGKSRLVAEALPGLADRLARTAVVVELEDAAPEQVAGRVASALGLSVSDQAQASVVEYLAAASLVLVLDACEGVLGPVRHLVEEVLRTAPGVSLVVTSRHRLGLSGEQVLPLAPLSPPAPEAEPEQAALAPAMRLFIDRLHRLRPGHVPASVLREAAEVCRRLDGLPLALELAAQQAASLGVATIAAGLEHQLDDASRPERSLRTVVARSYHLLSETDRVLLSRLSAFTGSVGLDDVALIAPEGHGAASLSRLVTASLVEADDEGAERRFRLLGVIRGFAAEQADAESGSVYWRWAAESSRRWARETTGAGAAGALHRMELASADLTAAAGQALSSGHLDLAAQITGHVGLCVHWVPNAALAEVILRVAAHPDLTGTAGESLARGAATLAAAERGDLEGAERLGASARAVAVDPHEQYLVQVGLGVTATYAGDWTTAEQRWAALLAIDGLPDVCRADAHAVLTLLAAAQGRVDDAENHAAAARRAAEQSGAAPRIAFALYAGGEALLVTDRALAVEVLHRAIAVADVANALQVSGVARVALLSALTRSGRRSEAAELSLTLLELQQRRGHWSQLWTTMRILAELFAATDHIETAELILAAAESSAPATAGTDVDRYRRLRCRVRDRLGPDRADRIAAVARLLPRTEILTRVRAAARALAAPVR